MEPLRSFRQEFLNLAGGIIACGLVVILAFLTWALVMREIPEANREPLLLLVGGLFTQIGVVVAFYFGSSATNKRQTETVEKAVDMAVKAQEAANPSPPAVTLAPGEKATVAAEGGNESQGSN